MKQIAKPIAVAAMAALLAGAAQAGSDYVVLSNAEAVDGRTFIDRSGARYRLHAIDAPELEQQCLGAGGEEYPCGQQAREALAEIVNGILTCDVIEAAGPGSQAVRCHDFAGRDIGALLISSGWALPDRRIGLDYVWDEMEAEARARGLWQGRFVMPERWRAGARL